MTATDPTTYQQAILHGFGAVSGRNAKHVYQFTVPDAVVAERRRKNRAARVARRLNRGRR